MKKKIAHIITKLELGGAQLNTIYSCNHFAKKGYDVYLLTGAGGIIEESNISPAVNIITIKNLVREINPIQDGFSLFKIYSFLKKKNIDIVHTHSSKAGIIGRIAAKFAGVKKIVHTIHGWGFTPLQNKIIFSIFVKLEKICASFTDNLIAVALSNINKGLQHNIGNKEKYSLIRSGIDFDGFMQNAQLDYTERAAFRKLLGIEENDVVIVNVSCFKPQKNILEFIRIAAELSSRFNNLKFLLVGDGEKRSEIEKMINEKCLEKKFILTGWQKNTAKYLKISDIFCLTSLWEGMPRAILEAYSCGLPVVTADNDGTNEAVSHNISGFLYKNGEIQKAIEYLEKLILNPSLRKQFADKGFSEIKNEFSLKKMLINLEKIYLLD